ncbi:MAG: TVP38/TMEM64 family protein [Actinomycetota bacterium]
MSRRHALLNPQVVVRGLVLIATLVVLGLLLEMMGFKDALDSHWIDSQVRGKGLAGEALFVLAGAAFVGVGMPRQLVCFLAGYAFGFVEGIAWSMLASLIGCVGSFWYARFMGRDLLAARFPDRVQKIDAFLSGNTLGMSVLIRLLPVGSNLVTNMAAGVSGAPALAFVAGSAIGYMPQTVIFTLLGSGITVDPTLRIGLSVVLFVGSGVLGVWLYRRYRHGKSLDAATEAELDAGEDANNDEQARNDARG